MANNVFANNGAGSQASLQQRRGKLLTLQIQNSNPPLTGWTLEPVTCTAKVTCRPLEPYLARPSGMIKAQRPVLAPSHDALDKQQLVLM
jgi:hypothetical protein